MTAYVIAQTGPQTGLLENGGFKQEGVASWYGEEFAGRLTAHNEVFDPKQFTAAHRTLPFDTVIIVTNVDNGKQVQVRVNDRGPFVGTRIVDVSKAAAEKLDMLVTGTANVSIEIAPRSFTPLQSDSDLSAGKDAASDKTASDKTASDKTAATNSAANAVANAAPQAAASTEANAAANAAQAQSISEAQSAVKSNNLPASPSDVRGSVYSFTPQPNLPRPTSPQAAAPATVSVSPAEARPPVAAATTTAAATPAVVPAPVNTAPQTAPAAPSAGIAPQKSNPNTWRPAVAPPPATPAPATQPVAPARPSATQTAAQPVTTTPPPPAAQQRPVTQQPAKPVVSNPAAAPATILGGPIVPGRIYRIQVGSFREASNAMKAYNNLTAAGFNPQWERHENMFRVVLTGVKTEDIPLVATKLGGAGFKEAVARLESVDTME